MGDDEKTVVRLNEILDIRDQRIEELEESERLLNERLDGSYTAWRVPRIVDDEHPGLPLPRMEVAWTPSAEEGWSRYECEYRIVHRHFLGHVMVTPFGLTRTQSGGGKAPWDYPGELNLPFRDGCHMHHDAAHLALPLYAILPTGPKRIDGDGSYKHARTTGMGHRR